MKNTILALLVLVCSVPAAYSITLDELDTISTYGWFDNEPGHGVIKQEDKTKYPWTVIRRHPIINGLRAMFADSSKGPSVRATFNEGKTWICKEFTALDLGGGARPSIDISFIFKKFGPMLENLNPDQRVRFYTLDKGELAGADMRQTGVIEAIRITEDGDLMVESSIEVNMFFKRILGEIMDTVLSRDKKEAKEYIKGQMAESVAGVNLDPEYYMDIKVLAYTLCPLTDVK